MTEYKSENICKVEIDIDRDRPGTISTGSVNTIDSEETRIEHQELIDGSFYVSEDELVLDIMKKLALDPTKIEVELDGEFWEYCENNKYKDQENVVYIENVTDFIRAVQFHEKQRIDNLSSERIFYRGQVNEGWGITASIFRGNNLHYEHKIINQVLHSKPFDFKDLPKMVSKLIKMQHYGIPTRLVDITSNPLVALYFACEEYYEDVSIDDHEDSDNEIKKFYKNKTDGEVFIIKDKVYFANEEEIEIIASLAEIKENLTYGEFNLHLKKKNIERNIKELKEILKKDYILEPYMNNDRITKQNGAFIIMGLGDFKLEEEYIIDKRQYNIENRFINEFKERYIIPADYKEQIRQELDSLGINRANLFPELEEFANDIKSRLRAGSLGYDYTTTISGVDLEDEDIESFTDIKKENMYGGDYVFDISLIKSSVIDLFNTNGIDNDDIYKEIEQIIDKNTVTDWYKKESIRSKLKIEFKKLLIKHDIKQINAEQIFDIMLNPEAKLKII